MFRIPGNVQARQVEPGQLNCSLSITSLVTVSLFKSHLRVHMKTVVST